MLYPVERSFIVCLYIVVAIILYSIVNQNKSLHNARQARRAELTNALASRIESLTSARSRLQVAVSNTTKLRDAWNRGSAEQDSMTVDTFKQAEAAVRVHDQAVFDAANACDQAVAALRTIGVEAKSGADEARNNRHAANAVAELRTLRGRAILRDALKSKQVCLIVHYLPWVTTC